MSDLMIQKLEYSRGLLRDAVLLLESREASVKVLIAVVAEELRLVLKELEPQEDVPF